MLWLFEINPEGSIRQLLCGQTRIACGHATATISTIPIGGRTVAIILGEGITLVQQQHRVALTIDET